MVDFTNRKKSDLISEYSQNCCLAFRNNQREVIRYLGDPIIVHARAYKSESALLQAEPETINISERRHVFSAVTLPALNGWIPLDLSFRYHSPLTWASSLVNTSRRWGTVLAALSTASLLDNPLWLCTLTKWIYITTRLV